MVTNQLKIFLRFVKELGVYYIFINTLDSSGVDRLIKISYTANPLQFYNYILFNLIYLNRKIFKKLLDEHQNFKKIINIKSRQLALDYFNYNQDLKTIFNEELKKCKWHNELSYIEYINKTNNIEQLFTSAFDWDKTINGIQYWKNVSDDFNAYLSKYFTNDNIQ